MGRLTYDRLTMNSAQFMNTLQLVPHFDGLAGETQQAIAVAATLRHFNGGQVIYLEGEPAESIYLLEAGWIKATRMTLEGREQAMLFLRHLGESVLH